jgi:hypothetical protein
MQNHQALLPGVSNVALCMRYYGVYAWLSAIYARELRPTRRDGSASYGDEALYALKAQRLGGETGVAGTLWATSKLAVFISLRTDPGGREISTEK